MLEKKEYLYQWQGSACLGIEQLQWSVIDVNVDQLVDYFLY